MPSSPSVLTVCSFNQTRSVLMASLFDQHATAAGLAHHTSSAGFSVGGQSATDNTVRYLASRGIDVSKHRSRAVADTSIGTADIVVTAEHAHVVSIAGRWPEAFDHTFTLPELVERGEAVGPLGERTVREWLRLVNSGRPTGLDYLDTTVGEIGDPTGRPPATWKLTFHQIDDLTARLVTLLT